MFRGFLAGRARASDIEGMKATPTIHVTMATLDSIPVIDLEGVLSATDIASCPQVQQIHQAFNRVGFVFLKNHGIGKQQVNSLARALATGIARASLKWHFIRTCFLSD